jgi:hypothetical protein
MRLDNLLVGEKKLLSSSYLFFVVINTSGTKKILPITFFIYDYQSSTLILPPIEPCYRYISTWYFQSRVLNVVKSFRRVLSVAVWHLQMRLLPLACYKSLIWMLPLHHAVQANVMPFNSTNKNMITSSLFCHF